MAKKTKNKALSILVSVASGLLATYTVVLPIISVCVYESTFGTRYQTGKQYEFAVSDFDGLQMELSDFVSGKTKLAGYKYSKQNGTVTSNSIALSETTNSAADTDNNSTRAPNTAPKGLVITAHGLGGGGHNAYLPFIDYFTSCGYLVFTYDAKGNDNSEGKNVGGLPQGIVDLYHAILYAKTIEEYKDLPIMLFGHSWGGYSTANVLNLASDIKAAVIGAGFNRSKDLLLYQGREMASFGADLLLPYFLVYERLKFGSKFTGFTGASGIKNSSANVLVVHSKDDDVVPFEYGYEAFYKECATLPRVTFVAFEDKGHNNLFFSKEIFAYRDKVNAEYKKYIEENALEATTATADAFADTHVDKKKYFELDYDLMNQIVLLFDQSCR